MENKALDRERLADVVQSVSCKYPSDLDVSLDESCQKVLLDYLEEVSLAALEQAAMLANHRGSNIVEEEDVQLVLDKKLGIPVPGSVKRAPPHKNSYHSMSLATRDGVKSKSDAIIKSNDSKRGVKRKSQQ